MKKIILILAITTILASCSNNPEETINTFNNETTTSINIITNKNDNTDLFSKTTRITFGDPKDVEKFKKELKEIDKEIKLNTGSITYDQILTKARLLDYLGRTGEALKLYVDNYNIDNNNKSLVYNHNIARLYESLEAYDEALKIYGILIKNFNRYDYLKDVANIWKKRGDEEKYEKAMEIYKKLNNTPGATIKNN